MSLDLRNSSGASIRIGGFNSFNPSDVSRHPKLGNGKDKTLNLKGVLEPVAKEKEPSRNLGLEVAGPHPAALLISFGKLVSKVKLEFGCWFSSTTFQEVGLNN